LLVEAYKLDPLEVVVAAYFADELRLAGDKQRLLSLATACVIYQLLLLEPGLVL